MGSVGMETAPPRMINREQTVAKTGRRMKKFTIRSFPDVSQKRSSAERSESLRLRNHRHTICQDLHSTHNNAVAWLNAIEHHVIIADKVTHGYDPLPRYRLLPLAVHDKGKHLSTQPRNCRHRNQ